MLAVAAARRLTPERLQKRLVGDIDAIVMRALRKEPQHRYNSIEQFAADVRRYLTREPVQARQGNWLYYSQRFIRRHAFGVTAGAAFIVFLVVFAMVSSDPGAAHSRGARPRQAGKQPRREGVRASCSRRFRTPIRSSIRSRRARPEIRREELLERAGRRVREDLSEQPQVRAQLLETIGRAYRRRGDDKSAIGYLQDAVDLRKQLSESEGGDEETAAVMVDLAISMRESGDVLGSDGVLLQAGDILHRVEQAAHGHVRQDARQSRPRADETGQAGRGTEVSTTRGSHCCRSSWAPRHRKLQRCWWTNRSPSCGRTIWWPPSATCAQRWRSTPRRFPSCILIGVMRRAQLGETLRLQGKLNEASVLLKDALLANRSDLRREQSSRCGRARLAREDPTGAARPARGGELRAAGVGHSDQGGRIGSLENCLLPHFPGCGADRTQRVRRGRRCSCERQWPHWRRRLSPIIRTWRRRSTIWARFCCGPIG